MTPDAVDHPAGDQEAQSVRYNEARNDVAVTLVIEPNIEVTPQHVLEDRLNQPQCGTVNVIDGRDEKQESADHPADVF